jgi:hypothetical protein
MAVKELAARVVDRVVAKEPEAVTMPPPVTHLIALGGVVYVATSMNVYRVAGDELVRLRWPGEKREG